MPAVPDWNLRFDLTSPYANLVFNVQTADGLYLLDKDSSSFDVEVRSTKNNVPQSDGSILHHRFLTGASMALTIHLMEDADTIACDDLAATMVDSLTGAFRSLLNAGDNEGRLSWSISGGNIRMLDDARLLVYPAFTYQGTWPTITATIDSEFPYAQDLNQSSTAVTSGGTQTLTNTGSAPYYPVFIVAGATSAFTITVVSPQQTTQFVYDSTLPGASAIAGGNCAEINCFKNTIFLDTGCTGAADDADLAAGVDQLNSEYPVLDVGANQVSITGANMTVLWAPAWG